ncbi:metalloregulator ArsR/SmtB family transcription factor [Robbsia sp. KACC 23696]|uniref:ArsR/SmtB family transcription factor n=1 Tax=Robbsia sp. KACC 23696 TaxID=3149231 RepID=UPI00325C19AF
MWDVVAQLFRLLGDTSRLRIVAACLDAPVCVSDIAAATALSPSLVSHHLRLLRGAGVVRGERRGKQIFYCAADEHVRRMIRDMHVHAVDCAPRLQDASLETEGDMARDVVEDALPVAELDKQS